MGPKVGRASGEGIGVDEGPNAGGENALDVSGVLLPPPPPPPPLCAIGGRMGIFGTADGEDDTVTVTAGGVSSLNGVNSPEGSGMEANPLVSGEAISANEGVAGEGIGANAGICGEGIGMNSSVPMEGIRIN